MNTFSLIMHQRTLLATALLATAMTCSTAWGQWIWKDASGRKVFSDTAPPSSVPAKDILRKPAGASPANPALNLEDTAAEGDASSDPATPPATAANGKKANSLADKVAAKQSEEKAKADAKAKAEEAKRNELREALLKQREANCERSRKAMATLDSGVRVSRVNDKGEKEVLDDKGRSEMAASHQRVIDKDCGPLE